MERHGAETVLRCGRLFLGFCEGPHGMNNVFGNDDGRFSELSVVGTVCSFGTLCECGA